MGALGTRPAVRLRIRAEPRWSGIYALAESAPRGLDRGRRVRATDCRRALALAVFRAAEGAADDHIRRKAHRALRIFPQARSVGGAGPLAAWAWQFLTRARSWIVTPNHGSRRGICLSRGETRRMSESQVEEVRRQGNGEARPDRKDQPAQSPPADPAKRRRTRLRIGAGAAVLALAGLLFWLHARKFEDTDDAQVDGYISAVSARVTGTVLRVLVDDNQVVKAGDPLIELDTADLDVALAQAKAAVAQAEAGLAAEQPNVSITATSN